MKKLSELIKQNFMLKLSAVVIAFMIWLTVVNISNPEVRGSVTVEIEVRNPDELTAADQMYSLDTGTVRVYYNVRSGNRNLIRAENFSAYIDLQDYSITGAVPVYVEADSSIASLISDITSDPMVIHVTTEDMQEKRFDIEVRQNGNVADGCALGELTLSQAYIYVTGPVSEVGLISSVGVEIDVNDRMESFDDTAEIVFYDANGHRIDMDERLTLSYDEISYHQEVYLIKSLGIVADSVGEPAEGYALESIEISPSFVSVYGQDEILDRYSSIEIPAEAIDISGADRNVTLTIDISPYIPEGLTLSEASSQITVIARIRQLPTIAESEDETDEEEDEEESGDEVEGPGAELSTEASERERGTETETAESETLAESTRSLETIEASEAFEEHIYSGEGLLEDLTGY